MPLPNFLAVYQELISTASISSTNPSWDQSNAKVIEKLALWFEGLGFDLDVIEIEKGKHNLVAKKGTGEGGLLLAGHTDTVAFDESRWTLDPLKLTEKNHRFYGLGTADMKGFFAFVYAAAKDMDWQKQKKPLYILATCDEETSMLGARHFSQEAAFKPDCCIIGEPTELIPIYAHKGHVANVIRITGKSGHSSDPALGINAIEIMHEVTFALMQLKQKLIKDYHHGAFTIPHPTLNLGHIFGGDCANRICGCCELHFDIRPVPGLSLNSLENLLQEALAKIKSKWGKRMTITALYHSVPSYECPLEHPFVCQVEKISQHQAQTVNYCTEAPFLQQLCPTLVLGPGSIAQAHQADEYLSLNFINPCIKTLKSSIQKFCF